jgi:hypothetical protein
MTACFRSGRFDAGFDARLVSPPTRSPLTRWYRHRSTASDCKQAAWRKGSDLSRGHLSGRGCGDAEGSNGVLGNRVKCQLIGIVDLMALEGRGCAFKTYDAHFTFFVAPVRKWHSRRKGYHIIRNSDVRGCLVYTFDAMLLDQERKWRTTCISQVDGEDGFGTRTD